MSSLTLTALLVLFTFGSGVPTARAESAAPDNLAEFNRGTTLYNAGHFDEAVLAFHRVVSNGSPLAPAATLYVAKCQRRLGNFDEAAQLLASLDGSDENLAAGLEDERRRLAEALVSAGTTALEAGRAVEALRLFEWSLAQNPGSEAAYGRALALRGAGRAAEAKEAFRGYVEMYPDGRYASDAAVLASGGKTASKGQLWLRLDLAGGYDSNVFMTAPADTPVSAAAVRGDVDLGWRVLEETPGTSLRLRYRGSWIEHVNQLSGRYVSHALRGEAFYGDEHWLLRAVPTATYQTVGADPYLLQVGGLVGADYATSDELGFGVQYEGYRNFAQSPTYRYIAGSSHWADLHVDRGLDQFRIRLSYQLGVEAIGDLFSGMVVLPLAHLAHGPAVRVVWTPDDWEMSLAVAYLFRRYDHPAQPGMRKRDDDQLGATVRAARSLGNQAALFVSVSVLWNRSTLDAASGINDRNYTQLVTLTGLTWNALD